MRLINNKIRNQKLNECPFVVTPTMTPKEVSFGGWGLMTMIMMMTGSRPHSAGDRYGIRVRASVRIRVRSRVPCPG